MWCAFHRAIILTTHTTEGERTMEEGGNTID